MLLLMTVMKINKKITYDTIFVSASIRMVTFDEFYEKN